MSLFDKKMQMRRHDLDWLRVIVFGLLIFYHVGMFFVPWDFHIKNNIIYEWITWPMLFLNQWRLPILFVISGMGTWYALGKYSIKKFSWERTKRLLLPLAFGMLFIIPPQVYVERMIKEQFVGSYFDYWPYMAFEGVYPVGNISWHHLWFLPYLLFYSILTAPLFIYLKNRPENSYFKRLKKWINDPSLKLIWLFLPFYFTYTIMREFFPVTHNFTNDWFTMVNYLLFFFMGFSLIGVGDDFWTKVDSNRRKLLICGLIFFMVFVVMNKFIEHTTVMHFVRNTFKVINIWLWILICFGYAAHYLNKPSNVLTYANEAVYPFYILHQSVMMVLCYFVIDLNWGFWLKASILIAGTFGISWLLYEFFIRRWNVVRPLFGLKNQI